VLRWISHGASGDVTDMYTKLPWTALCEAVATMKISLRTGAQIIPIRRVLEGVDDHAAKSVAEAEIAVTGAVTGRRPKRERAETKKVSGSLRRRGGRDSKASCDVKPARFSIIPRTAREVEARSRGAAQG
jgi:hypothetical protein